MQLPVRKALTLAALLIPILIACSGPTTDSADRGAPPSGRGGVSGDFLNVFNDEDTAFRGTGSANGLEFRLEARTPAEGLTVIRVALPRLAVDAWVDQRTRSLLIDGHNTIVSDRQRHALSRMAALLQNAAAVNTANGRKLPPSPLVHLVDYLAHAPVNHRFQRIQSGCSVKGSDPPPAWYGAFMLHAETARCSANEGITCIARGSTVNADYDDARGCHSEAVVVGSTARRGYECMGRCGPGCGGGAPGVWTKDCLDHDQCSHKNMSSGGLTDSNCGDEYRQAADDWLFGVLKGCRS